jgi:hypothetical protein
MYFDNGALLQHADYEPLRKGIADILITELHVNPAIRVVERDQLQALLEEQNLGSSNRVDQATAVRIGKLLGAHHMILGGFVIDMKNRVRLDARAVEVETSRVEHTQSVTGTGDDLLAMITTLAARLNAGMKLPDLPRTRPPPPRVESRGERASAELPPWRALMTYSRALAEEDKKNPAGAKQLYKEFLAGTPPTFASAQREQAQKRIAELQ